MKKQGLKEKADKLIKSLGKFKYAVLVLLLGVVLMVFPGKEREVPEESVTREIQMETGLSEQLEDLLAKVNGVGRVRVLLTQDTGVMQEYHTDGRLEQSADTQRRETSTVLVSSGSGTENALVKKTTNPTYRGAVVICDGADSASVKLNVIQAVSSLTGLGSDKIVVIKMSEG